MEIFDSISADLADVDPALRPKLAELLYTKAQLFHYRSELCAKKAKQLSNPSNEQDAELVRYSEEVVKPIRRQYSKLVVELFEHAVDRERLKNMLPMALYSLSHAVNVPLVLNMLDADPDMLNEMADHLKEFFSDRG